MVFKGYKPRKDRLERFLQRLCESGELEILGKVMSSLSKGNDVDSDYWSVIMSTMKHTLFHKVFEESYEISLGDDEEFGVGV
ncbi:unnamed protein product [Cochlearia groenlandica]